MAITRTSHAFHTNFALNIVEQIDLISIFHSRDPVGVSVEKHLCGVTKLFGCECRLDPGHEHFGCPGVLAGIGAAEPTVSLETSRPFAIPYRAKSYDPHHPVLQWKY